MFLISIHLLPKCRQKICCGATAFFNTALHLSLLSPVFVNSFQGLPFPGCIGTLFGAVHLASLCRKTLSTYFASLRRQMLQRCIQFRIVGKHALPEIPAHGISTVNLFQHHAVTVQRQTAKIFVIIGAAVCHKFSDSSSFFFGQFPNVFCHGQMIPFCFVFVVSNPSCPLGLPPH